MAFRNLILIFLSILLFQNYSSAQKKCIPAEEYLPFEGDWAKAEASGYVELGSYSRISPDGNYVLRSLSGSYLSAVTLMKLSSVGEKEFVLPIETSFSNEAFPVQGSWRFLVEINRSHHRLSEVVQKSKSSKKDFVAGVNGFYTTAAEMSFSQDQVATIRSLSWPTGDMLSNNQGQGELKNRVYKVQKQIDGNYKVLDETKDNYLCNNLSKTEGQLFTLPMISTDGTEFSAMPINPVNKTNSMRIYRILENNKDCELVDDLGYAGSKMIFGFARKGMKAPIIFRSSSSLVTSEAGTGLFIIDRNLKTSFEIAGLKKYIIPDSFPGLTKDGRVVVGARWQDCANSVCKNQTGYVRIDPYQTHQFKKFRAEYPHKAEFMPECITFSDINP